MRVAIMQPYFLPYIGYYQLIGAVDVFVVYDNIKYTKKGWINRNRMLINGADEYFTLPLKKGSDYLDIKDRYLALEYRPENILAKISAAYRKAPYFKTTYNVLEEILRCSDRNLFGYIYESIKSMCAYLDLKTKIVVSSEVDAMHDLRGAERVLSICHSLGADTYINAIGGIELYDKVHFSTTGINLQFIKTDNIIYEQLGHAFVPWLSIIDVLMFNSVDVVKEYVVHNYQLV